MLRQASPATVSDWSAFQPNVRFGGPNDGGGWVVAGVGLAKKQGILGCPAGTWDQWIISPLYKYRLDTSPK